MKILLTGSRGYIGTVMAPFLVEAGHEVVGIDTDIYRRSTFGPWCESIRTLCKDVRAVEVSDLRGLDAVIHLAALSNDPLGDLNPRLTYDINHLASVQLAEKAKAAGVARFAFASSCSNYGAAGDAPVNEESELNPVTT
jgi:nucleoside-diphosphate-sugar epimerase